jgi:GxxExxY protein
MVLEQSESVIYPEESYAIMGACFEVYRRIGCGFLEGVYQDCLEIEFAHRGIPFVAHPELRLEYRGKVLQHSYHPDLICYGKIVLELKAISYLVDEHRSQVLNYLHATRLELGLLINFGHHPRLEYQRLALSDQRPKSPDTNTR